MSDKIVKIEINLSEIIFIVGIFVLIILCAGTPDLLDAIIKNVGGY